MMLHLKISVYCLILICWVSNSYAQVGENVGCVFVDFEIIAGQIPTDNMVISDQFYDEYGVTFALEDGTSPVLAQVGAPATAFSSQWGSDTPAPGVDIGSFFVTDNGTLAGLEAIPLLVNFEFPLDSLSGCILDLDLSEVFTIDALDENGNVLESYQFSDGDPGTGDGQAKCFGYNMDGCEGSIYGLRFSGTRIFQGGFGLGMDNFAFCFTGIDIINNLDVEVEDATCDGGSINLMNTGSDEYQYSLDGITYVDSASFNVPQEGEYTIYVINEDGCTADFDVVVGSIPEVTFDNTLTVAMSTTCAEDNGSISAVTNITEGITFSLNDGEFQQSNRFENLSPGEYLLVVQDSNGCLDSTTFTIEPSLDIDLETIEESAENCNLENGTITLTASGGGGPLLYQIDNGELTNNPVFEGLTAGNYNLIVTDGTACSIEVEASIENIGDIIISNVNATDVDCETQFASVEVSASGGLSELTYQLGGEVSSDPNFNSVVAGTYEVVVSDDEGCEVVETLEIEIPNCPILLPNIISVNSQNDIQSKFLLATNPSYDVEVLKYMIFDRWGNLVHKSGGWTIHNGQSFWWDGRFNGKPVSQGVYTYRIDVRHLNGYEESLTGDLTVIW